jgi:hypothetical protein
LFHPQSALSFRRLVGEIPVGRPLGSPNRDKPFNDVLRIALKARPHSLRRIVDRLVDGAEEGNLHYIREIADRLDGKPVQGIDRRVLSINSINELTDEELLVIASGGRCRDESEMKVISPPSKD